MGLLDNGHLEHTIVVGVGEVSRGPVDVNASVELVAYLGLLGNDPREAGVDRLGGVAGEGGPGDNVLGGGFCADFAVKLEHVVDPVQEHAKLVGDGARVGGLRSDAVHSDLDREALADPEVHLVSNLLAAIAEV